MDFRYLYTSFDGRINRKPFWLASLAMMVAVLILSMALVIPFAAASPATATLISLVIWLVFLYPAVALGVKRLHDRGKSGRLMAVFLAPSVISQVAGLLGLTGGVQIVAGQAVYMPNTLGWILSVLSFAVGIWALVELGFLKGTAGANEYGPDPLAMRVGQPAAG